MTHYLMPNMQPSIELTPLPSPSTRTETTLPVLNLDQRRRFAQRLAVLIRRIQTHPQIDTKEKTPHES